MFLSRELRHVAAGDYGQKLIALAPEQSKQVKLGIATVNDHLWTTTLPDSMLAPILHSILLIVVVSDSDTI